MTNEIQKNKNRLKTWIAERMPKKTSGTVYLVKDDRERKRKLGWVAGVGFVVGLGVVIGMGQIRRQQMLRRQSGIDQTIETITRKFDEARALTSLNPTRSRELLKEVKEGLEGLGEGEVKKEAKLAEIASGFGEVLGEASGIKKVEAREVFDLSLLREGMKGGRLAVRGELVVVWDPSAGSGRLVEVEVSKKSGKVIAAGEEVAGGKLIATYPGKIVVFGEKGVVQCSMLNDKCSIVIKKDEEWGEIVDMQMFAGNIYLLDRGKKQIWRYQVTEAGYGERRAWSTTEVVGEQMAIDGNIWIVAKTQKLENSKTQIEKYNRGARDNFVMEELDKPLGETVKVYAGEDGDELYLWDKGNGRVVVVKETGEYVVQYRNESFGKVDDLAVDFGNKKIYMVRESKILEVDL